MCYILQKLGTIAQSACGAGHNPPPPPWRAHGRACNAVLPEYHRTTGGARMSDASVVGCPGGFENIGEPPAQTASDRPPEKLRPCVTERLVATANSHRHCAHYHPDFLMCSSCWHPRSPHAAGGRLLHDRGDNRPTEHILSRMDPTQFRALWATQITHCMTMCYTYDETGCHINTCRYQAADAKREREREGRVRKRRNPRRARAA